MAEFAVVQETGEDGVSLISLCGEMEAAAFLQLEDEFNRLLESGTAGVVLDLSKLEAITSAGLGAIINLAQRIEENGGGLVVAAPAEPVRKIIDLFGLGETFTIADTIEQAKTAVAGIRPAAGGDKEN